MVSWILSTGFIGAFLANALVLINSRGAFLAVVGGAGYYMYQLYFSTARVKYQRMVLLGMGDRCLGWSMVVTKLCLD